MRIHLGTRKTEEVANQVKDAILANDFGCKPVVEISKNTDYLSMYKGCYEITLSNIDWNDFDRIKQYIDEKEIY